ncbi:MAG TPA: triose-phosphate isomerase [Candidatus Limnocylindrales bacterium]|nr:triose-phosphate isomerase [Candidatus Limnocylindrales bacterium]
MITPLVVGNWKMNGNQVSCIHLARQIVRLLRDQRAAADVALAPPFTALAAVAQALRQSPVKLAAQNSHWAESGAFTGEVSAPMLTEMVCLFVILGHSERRHVFHESDDMIARKLAPVLAHGMRPILCVGETLSERRHKKTLNVVTAQLDSALKGLRKGVIDKLEIAYEPVWAIGTGQNATPEQVDQVHASIRAHLKSFFGSSKGKRVRILYGGSVKPENVSTLTAIKEVNGFLVGGASLIAESFVSIVQAFSAAAK